MRRLLTTLMCVSATAATACGRSQQRSDTATTSAAPAATPAATPAAAPAAAPLSLAQAEGNWQGKTMPETGDSVVATWTLSAPSDTTKWSTSFSKGPKNIPVHIVSIAGDSLVAQMGNYKSPTRKAMVTTRLVSRFHGDTLVGTFESHFVAKPDSTFRGRLVAVKSK